jgi:hypothetical protein
MKIAPNLKKLTAPLPSHGPFIFNDTPVMVKSRTELRALLAVARAAQSFKGRGCDCHPNSPASRMRRALTRLEKVSKP